MKWSNSILTQKLYWYFLDICYVIIYINFNENIKITFNFSLKAFHRCHVLALQLSFHRKIMTFPVNVDRWTVLSWIGRIVVRLPFCYCSICFPIIRLRITEKAPLRTATPESGSSACLYPSLQSVNDAFVGHTVATFPDFTLLRIGYRKRLVNITSHNIKITA